MMRGRKIVLPALLLLEGAAGLLYGYNQEGFTGSRVKNPDAYLLDMERMNGTDEHTLKLQDKDVLRIRFETRKGELDLEIIDPDGTEIYCGNGKDITDFTLHIEKGGTYTIRVDARHAAGTLHIQAEKGTSGQNG